ncbi:MAG TPA: glycosyl hydrolase [Methanothrix sp.]|jgi:hypothetical protein|uniref:glycosyl hydrolase n=3 Tax=Methanothrix sp. TaxID=90426 RepID=UPI002C50DA95|nr:glycosyl hydrolase [Euryarchaeota archaeon]HON34707.1 glycosyl hydrolase [Methanothrix sp.]
MKWANSTIIVLILYGLAITSGTGLAASTWSVSQHGDILEIAYGSGTNFNQYAALHLDSSYFRMNHGPDSGWGTSVILAPSFKEGDTYYQNATITHSWTLDGNDLLIHFSGQQSHLGFAGDIRIHPPARDLIAADVSVTTSGYANPVYRPGETFKPVMFSSMHISEDNWDAKMAYAGSQYFSIPSREWIHPPVVAGSLGLLGGSCIWKANAPTVEIIFENPMPITGWITFTQDPNDDNVGYWPASDTVMRSWNYTIVSKLHGCYTGAYLGCGSEDSSCLSIEGFNDMAGKDHALFMKYVDIADSLNTDIWDWARDVKANGATPVFMYDPYDGLNSIDTAKVEYFATKCKELDTKVLIIFGHEMNGNWYVWGQKPAGYITRFKQVAEIFHRIAPRAEMCWVPNQNWGYPWGGIDYGDGYTEYYPSGSGTYGEYVDWVGLAFYDKDHDETNHVSPGFFLSNIKNGQDGINFYKVFSEGKNKPMLIGETGAFDPNLDPTGPGVRRPLSDVMQDRYKNEWISEVYDAAQLETEFPRLKGIMYFNVLKTEPKIETRNHWGGSAFLNVLADYRIPDDPNVYRQLISNPYFLGASSVLYYPDFTDTANVNSWRSYLVLQNPSGSDARAHLEIRSRDGAILYIGKQTIPRFGSIAIRPRDLVGTDCSGSVKAASDQHIQGTCQINRNNNEMCMEYNALDSGATTLYYPDFTDTANPDSWRSWLVVQNPTFLAANIHLEIRSREGAVLFSGSQAIPAHCVAAIRPRNLVGLDCAGSATITSDQPLIGTCQITRNSNKMCMSYTASDRGSNMLYYPDFTDTANPDSWRSWLVVQNPSGSPANVDLKIRSREGILLFSGSQVIPAHGVGAIRPRTIAGADCAGSVVVTSNQPIVGTCQITRNSNEMCMSYNALDHGSKALYYPDFTDTTNPSNWRSWLVLQNPTNEAANINLDIRSRKGDPLYSGSHVIPAHGVAAIRPRSLVGSDCSGSVTVTSNKPIAGTCQITRNNNLMCMSYVAFGAISVDWLPSV